MISARLQQVDVLGGKAGPDPTIARSHRRAFFSHRDWTPAANIEIIKFSLYNTRMPSTEVKLSTRLVGDSQLTVVNQHLQYRQDEVVFPNGNHGTYTYVVDDYAAAATVPLDRRDGELSVFLVLLERYPSGTIGREAPCGKPERDETQLQAAQRELAEEAHLQARFWQQLPQQVENVGRGNSRSDVFIAADLSPLRGEADGTEAILDRRWFKMREVDELACTGKISAGHTMASLFVATAFLRCIPEHKIARLLAA